VVFGTSEAQKLRKPENKQPALLPLTFKPEKTLPPKFKDKFVKLFLVKLFLLLFASHRLLAVHLSVLPSLETELKKPQLLLLALIMNLKLKKKSEK
jgi:hypothetical protein